MNSEFYAAETAGIFLNSSFGVGKDLSQTGVNGPSIFPVTATAVRLKAELFGGTFAQGALFDAQAGDPRNPYGTHLRYSAGDGTLAIVEVGWRSNGEEEGARMKASVGGWGYSKPVPTLNDSAVERLNRGLYAVWDHALSARAGYFVKYGAADPALNSYASCLTTGVSVAGFLDPENERIAFGVARTRFGEEARNARITAGDEPSDDETAYELTYRWAATSWLNLQPNLQRVVHPGLNARAAEVTISGARVELHFEF